MKKCRMTIAALTLLVSTGAQGFEKPAGLDKAIATIRGVGPGGKGSADAARAWLVLAKADADQLTEVLAGMDGANALARNWLRAAVDEILDRAQQDKKTISLEALESFLRDTQHDPQARRLAYELIVERQPGARERLLPDMLDDPSPDLRRDSVARLLDQAEKGFQSGQKKEALPIFKKCLAAARDKGQIDKSARRLRELGEPVDLPTHLGFIMDWKLLGPFPNVKQKGIGTVYPPEEKIDLAATYEGKLGKVRWQNYVSQSEAGLVDLFAGLGKEQEGTSYAFTEFTAPAARDAEIRLGCFTVFKLWVNGVMVLERGDAYTGMSFDHYTAPIHLKAGKNVILMKLCRDAAPPQVPNIWQFQLRVCDPTGVAILSTTRPSVSVPKKS